MNSAHDHCDARPVVHLAGRLRVQVRGETPGTALAAAIAIAATSVSTSHGARTMSR
ncbi:MAG: hypothetical protein ABI327_15910 [Burkholderiaceae bacterium]